MLLADCLQTIAIAESSYVLSVHYGRKSSYRSRETVLHERLFMIAGGEITGRTNYECSYDEVGSKSGRFRTVKRGLSCNQALCPLTDFNRTFLRIFPGSNIIDLTDKLVPGKRFFQFGKALFGSVASVADKQSDLFVPELILADKASYGWRVGPGPDRGVPIMIVSYRLRSIFLFVSFGFSPKMTIFPQQKYFQNPFVGYFFFVVSAAISAPSVAAIFRQ